MLGIPTMSLVKIWIAVIEKVYAYHHGRKLYERLSAGEPNGISKTILVDVDSVGSVCPGDMLLIEREGQEQAGNGRIFQSEVGKMNIFFQCKMSF